MMIMMMIILRQRLAAVVPGGSPTSRLLKLKGKTRQGRKEGRRRRLR
jgi:hypothetical protein